MNRSELEQKVRDYQVLGTTDLQWGDNGKGKVADALASFFGFNVRGTGGANAGHTVHDARGRAHIFNSVPSAILHDSNAPSELRGEGGSVVNVLGEGMVIDPEGLIAELDKLGFVPNDLILSHNATLVLPYHKLIEEAEEAKGNAIGTTKKGIGPAYEDRTARRALRVNDLLNPHDFRSKVLRVLEKLEGRFTLEPRFGSLNAYAADLTATFTGNFAERLKPFIADAGALVRERHADGGRIHLEGAQGLLLSFKDGTYPFVTSSDPSIDGLALGAGLRPGQVDRNFGIAKAYMTRVGNGPFPTELGGRESDRHCNEVGSRDEELRRHGRGEESAIHGVTLNDESDLDRGIALRLAGGEYGATTGRPRRTGWLDLVALRHAAQHGGTDVVLTKVDVLTGMKEIKVCTSYEYDDPQSFNHAGDTLQRGDDVRFFPTDATLLERCKPRYATLPGWDRLPSDMKTRNGIPVTLQGYLDFISEEAGVNIVGLSYGPRAEQLLLF